MKKLLSITLLSVLVLLISWCSIKIKTKKELEEERAKKQEINNIISWLNQEISWLEQTLMSLNKEIDLLQPRKDSEKNQKITEIEMNWNEQIISGLELSGLDFNDSIWIIEAIDILEQDQKTWSELNWMEKILNWFKKIFNWWNNETNIWSQFSWINQTSENTSLQISWINKETAKTNEKIIWSKSNTLNNKNIKPNNAPINENICSSDEINACISNMSIYKSCSEKCRENKEVLNKRSILCEKDFWEWFVSIRDIRISSHNCVCKEWYQITEMTWVIELSDGTMGSKRYCKKM